jgi:hypothetical protein
MTFSKLFVFIGAAALSFSAFAGAPPAKTTTPATQAQTVPAGATTPVKHKKHNHKNAAGSTAATSASSANAAKGTGAATTAPATKNVAPAK